MINNHYNWEKLRSLSWLFFGSFWLPVPAVSTLDFLAASFKSEFFAFFAAGSPKHLLFFLGLITSAFLMFVVLDPFVSMLILFDWNFSTFFDDLSDSPSSLKTAVVKTFLLYGRFFGVTFSWMVAIGQIWEARRVGLGVKQILTV